MRRQKKWIPVLCLLVLLAAALLWYARPVNIYTLQPQLEPDRLNVMVSRFLSDGYRESREANLDSSDPSMAEVLAQLEALRFRRPPGNLMRQFQKQVITGRQVRGGEYEIRMTLYGRTGHSLRLGFFIDEWSYSTPSDRELPLSVSNGETAGKALAETLWALGTPVTSPS